MRVVVEGREETELSDHSSAKDLVELLKLKGPAQGLGAKINGELKDIDTPLRDGDVVKILDFEDDEGKEMFWHTSAHVLAQAVLRIWPDAIPTIGPPISRGFYYDFANLQISDSDLPRIEEEMKKIISENHKPKRDVLDGKAAAVAAFHGNYYKIQIIDSIEEEECFTAYRQGEFYDLCRGPHIPNLGKIKALKVLKTAGAYWKGDSKNEMLTRIYGITFPDRHMLKAYLKRLEEAKKRDHRILGPRLDLFSLKEEAPGMPFFHPHGMKVWQRLMDFWQECHTRADYVEIKTPVMMTRELWETSGHWDNYRDHMFSCSIENREYAIKPMNCPGGMLFYKSSIHSYRELPLRVAEIGNVHRFEPSGAISGLFRVRSFHQDDAHIFMEKTQIAQEILAILHLADEMYTCFGLTYHLELSTRPEKNTIGSDADWETATKGLKEALDATNKSYIINEGDGAFYGPKIDIHIRDALERTWQCGTIQLDMSLPERFELEYSADDGKRKRPIMIHRAIYGSIERFFGILIEHFSGRFPLWMSPRQVRVLPVADRHLPYALNICEEIQKSGFDCTVDQSAESVGKKVREAQLQQVNYMLTVGDQEVENQTINLRTRDNIVVGELRLQDFTSVISGELRTRKITSPYTK